MLTCVGKAVAQVAQRIKAMAGGGRDTMIADGHSTMIRVAGWIAAPCYVMRLQSPLTTPPSTTQIDRQNPETQIVSHNIRVITILCAELDRHH